MIISSWRSSRSLSASFRRPLLTGLVAVVWSCGAFANQPTAAAPTAGASAPFNVPPVPSFAAQNVSGIQSVLAQCSGQGFADALGGIAACSMMGSTEEFDSNLDLSCSFLSPQMASTIQLKVAGAISAQTCKKTQIASARGKLDCLSQGVSLLQAMIGQQRDRFEQEIQIAQNSLRQLTQVRKGFEQQDEVIGKRLNGDEESGAKGLIQAQQTMEGALEEMGSGGDSGAGTIAQFKKTNRDIEDRKKFLLEQVQARTLELTTSCMARGGNQGNRYQCQPNTPDVDYFTFLGCQYEASFSVGEGGRLERDAVNRKRGEVNRQSFIGALQDLLVAVPRTIPSVPSGQMDRYYGNTGALWFSFNDFKNEIQTRLAKFESRNFKISNRLLQKAEACFDVARSQVAKERTGAGSPANSQGAGGGKGLVDIQNEIKTREEGQQAYARKFFLNADKSYSESVKSLLGRNVTLPLDACRSAKPLVQASCMDKIRDSFEDILLGKSELSKVNMVVPGNGAVRDLVIQCTGLKGCVADFQAQHDYLKTVVKQVDQAKQKYASEANQKIDAMRTSLAKAMAFPNQLVIQQQDELNRFLAGLGVEASVQLEDIEGKAFEQDDNEDLKPLYKNPVGDEFLQAISAGSTPPLKKVGKDSFKDAYKGIAEAVKTADKEIAKLNSLTGKVTSALAKCQQEAAEKILSKLEGAANDVSECSKWMDMNDSDKSALQDLYGSIQGVSSVDGSGIDDALSNGISSFGSAANIPTGDTYDKESCKGRYRSAITKLKSGSGQLRRLEASNVGAGSAL